MMLDLGSEDVLERPCPSCMLTAVRGKLIAPHPDLARRGVETVFETRCYACGDVRLFYLKVCAFRSSPASSYTFQVPFFLPCSKRPSSQS